MGQQGLRAIVERHRIETGRRLQASTVELFIDDELEFRIGAQSPRTRPVWNGVSAFGELTSGRTRICLEEFTDFQTPWIVFRWKVEVHCRLLGSGKRICPTAWFMREVRH